MRKIKWACVGFGAFTLFIAAHIGLGVVGGVLGGGAVAELLHAGHHQECCCEAPANSVVEFEQE